MRRISTREVLARLGVGDAARGWSDVVALEPSRALPVMIARDGAAAEPRSLPVARFVEAHRAAVLHGFVADRIDDGQATDGRLPALRAALRDAWAVALARALGDGRAGRHLVATAERGWRSAVREERRAFARGRLSVRAYARLSLARLWWAGLASDALLQACGARSVRPGFRSAFGHLVACLQCTDDAFDADEDRRVRGASVPDLIGLPAAALARASVHLARSGGEVARRAGLHRLARWLRRRGAELELRVGASPGFGVELAALGIAEACAGEIERMPPFPDLSLTRSADRSAHRPTASGSRAPRTPRAASPAPSARRVRARS